jgi:glycosyltransferase 2 family protein
MIGAVLSWLALKDLSAKDKADILQSLSEANYAWVVVSMFCGITAHLSRSIRWKMLLKTLGFNPSLQNTFYAVMVGYLGNLALPRLGEVLRCGILKRYNQVPIPSSLGTVIAERLIDVLMLLLLFIVSICIEYNRMKQYIHDTIFTPLSKKLFSYTQGNLLWIMLPLALLLFLIFIFRKKINNHPIASNVKFLLVRFLDGMKTIANVKSPLLFFIHSLFIWLMYLLSVYVCVFAFNETQTMTFTDCLAIMCFGSLGVIATPGGVGAYQWIVLQLMVLWGYSATMGVAFGWIAWLSQTIVVLVVGLLSFALLGVANKKTSA